MNIDNSIIYYTKNAVELIATITVIFFIQLRKMKNGEILLK